MQRRWWSAVAAAVLVAGGGIALATLVLGRDGPAQPRGTGHSSAPAWLLLATPKLGGRTDLRSIACGSPTSCVAVGSTASAGLPTALVESWNGRVWSVARSDNRGVDSWLNSAACPAAGWCVAVGGDSPTGDSDNPLDQTLVEVLTGGRWSVIPSPTPGTGDQSDLQSVACTSPSFCVAVGSFSPVSNPYDPETRPLVEMWDGTTWTVATNTGPALGRQSVLRSVVCTAETSCTAVGSSSSIAVSGDSAGRALVERWDGASWTSQPTPSSGLGTKSSLQSVSCPSASSCVAVGSFTPTGDDGRPGAERTLVERWDGSAWSVVASPNRDSAPSSLQAVSCTSPLTCVAVGSYSTGAALEDHQALAETWDGRAWSTAPAALSNSELAAIVCSARDSCTAVGRAATRSSISAQWQAVVATLTVTG